MFSVSNSMKREIEALRAEVAALTGAVKSVQALVGPMGIPYPDGSMLVQSVDGIKYLIDPNDLVIGPQLMVYRQWEPEISHIIRSALTRDTVFVDVGASFGYFTCFAAAMIGVHGKGQVIAIEPNPAMLTLLRKNRQINWSICPVTIHGCAVGDKIGLADFLVPADRAANATLASPGTLAAPGGSSSEKISVKLKRLDDVVPAGTSVDLMKIDVEGHECAVLAGGARTVSESPNLRILMEWSLGQMQAAGYSVDAIAAQFDALGLVPCAMPPDLILANAGGKVLSRDDLAALAYDNIVLIKR
jgi:FkbM family methyltransferase